MRPDWDMPYGPMPYITGLPAHMSFASKKALTAAAANYGCAMLWAEGHTSHLLCSTQTTVPLRPRAVGRAS